MSAGETGGRMGLRMPYRITKGGWGFLVLCILLCLGAFNAGLNLIYLLDSLLLSVFFLAAVAPVWTMRGIACRRSLAEIAYANEPFLVNFHLSNHRNGSAHFVEVADSLCGESADASNGIIVKLDRGEQARVQAKALPLPRGAHYVAGLQWGSRFPFGVAERWRSHEQKDELLVFPMRGKLSRSLVMSMAPSGTHLSSPAKVGLPGDEFRTVRDYKSGDNPHWIHWRATAHHGKLLVREMERERSAPVMVLFDSRIPRSFMSAQLDRARESLERAAGFVAEISRVAQDQGNPITLIGYFPEPKILRSGDIVPSIQQNGSGPSTTTLSYPAGEMSVELRHIMESLARMKPSEDRDASGLRAVAEDAGLYRAWRVLAVTLTPETAQGLAPILAGSRSQIFVASEPAFREAFQPFGQEGAA